MTQTCVHNLQLQLHQLSVFKARAAQDLMFPLMMWWFFPKALLGSTVCSVLGVWLVSFLCFFFRWWYLSLPKHAVFFHFLSKHFFCIVTFFHWKVLICHAQKQTWQLNTWSADVSPRMLLKQQRELRVASHWMGAMLLTQKSWRTKSGEANTTTVSVYSSPSAPPASMY